MDSFRANMQSEMTGNQGCGNAVLKGKTEIVLSRPNGKRKRTESKSLL